MTAILVRKTPFVAPGFYTETDQFAKTGLGQA
jgi:hypothetical protein